MVQVRVVRKGMDFNKIAEEIGVDVKRLKEGTMIQMAGVITANSPVDSGYYVKNHEVSLRSGSFQSNAIRPPDAERNSRGGNVNAAAARQEGFNLMVEEIKQLDLASENFVFRNRMAYSGLIEGGATGYKTGNPPVYAAAVREAPQIIQEVAQRIAARSR